MTGSPWPQVSGNPHFVLVLPGALSPHSSEGQRKGPGSDVGIRLPQFTPVQCWLRMGQPEEPCSLTIGLQALFSGWLIPGSPHQNLPWTLRVMPRLNTWESPPEASRGWKEELYLHSYFGYSESTSLGHPACHLKSQSAPARQVHPRKTQVGQLGAGLGSGQPGLVIPQQGHRLAIPLVTEEDLGYSCPFRGLITR